MYLCYADETNCDPKSSEFFIYGAAVIPGDTAEELSQRIEKIRETHKFSRHDLLKFSSRSRPKAISRDVHLEAKKALIAAASESNVKLIVSMVHHDIAKNPDEARRNEINRICYHYNCLLSREKAVGLMMLDNFTDKKLHEILQEKFMVGIEGKGLPHSSSIRLDRILGFGLSTIGSSHFSSIVDVVLGTFRYVVNEMNDPGKEPTLQEMIKQISPLFVRSQHTQKVSELSLFFSPKKIKVTKYRQKYTELRKFLANNAIEAEQTI